MFRRYKKTLKLDSLTELPYSAQDREAQRARILAAPKLVLARRLPVLVHVDFPTPITVI